MSGRARTCTDGGCERNSVARRLCGAHYQAAWKVGELSQHVKLRPREKARTRCPELHKHAAASMYFIQHQCRCAPGADSIMSETVRATVYLQVQPEYSWWAKQRKELDTANAIEGAKVVGLTQTKSQKPRPETVEVKITVELRRGAFLPLRPEAIVVIPETLTQPNPVTVEAGDPNEVDD